MQQSLQGRELNSTTGRYRSQHKFNAALAAKQLTRLRSGYPKMGRAGLSEITG